MDLKLRSFCGRLMINKQYIISNKELLCQKKNREKRILKEERDKEKCMHL